MPLAERGWIVNRESKLLLALLRQEVAGRTEEIPADIDWDAFVKLAAFHSLEALSYSGLQKHAQVPGTVLAQLEGAYHHAIFRDTQFAFTRAELTKALADEGVPHIFLKGSCLKHDYPIPALRTMSDIDLLIYVEDFEKIDRAAVRLAGERKDGDGNHRNYCFPGGVMVEFHPNLLHHATPVGTGVNPGWQYALEESSCGERLLSEEGFYLSILCHLANHFVCGGVGVRFVLDIWVCRHLRKTQPDRSFVEQELERFDLLDFTRKIEALSEAWFGDGALTPELEELGEYILTSGTHGTTSRAMLNAVSLSPGGSGASALWKKAFYPRQELEDRYTWCRGKPWLLPAAWCARAFQAVTRRGHLILAWRKGVSMVSEEDVKTQQDKLKRFGIERTQK